MELWVPLERGAMASHMLRRLRRRRLSRRLLIYLAALCLIALTAAGLVWLLEGFRTYSPVYYEPKDIERERYETQRRSLDTKPGPQVP
jgi:membrane-anchored protein YejM (alkaline phosphatase superfamily)